MKIPDNQVRICTEEPEELELEWSRDQYTVHLAVKEFFGDPDIKAYCRCMRNIDQIQDGKGESEEVELLRNQMDFHWSRLNEDEIRLVYEISSNRRDDMSTVTVSVSVYESRWGYHPCSYGTYHKLKVLHKRYWQTVHAFHEWLRWNRKEPQNRVIRRWFRDSNGNKIGSEVVDERPAPKYCPHFLRNQRRWLYDHGIVEAYQQARMPVRQDQVCPLKMTEKEINKLYEQVENWFTILELSKQKPKRT